MLSNVFNELPNLRTLVLNNNPLPEVSIPFERLQNLETFSTDEDTQVLVTGQEFSPASALHGPHEASGQWHL